MFNNTTLPVLENVVAFTQARHGVLAGNIANLSTPGYKSRDLSPDAFEASLNEALQTHRTAQSPGTAGVLGEWSLDGDPGLGLTRLDSDNAVSFGKLDAEALAGVRESMKEILYHDESDVSLENQIAEISKNQSKHNLAIALMRSQYAQLRAAISESVG